MHVFSIYFTGMLSSYNCPTPCFVGSFSSFHYQNITLFFQMFSFSHRLALLGSIFTTFVNIEILSGTFPKPLTSHSTHFLYNLFHTYKTIKILSPAQILPLSFRHIYNGLLDSCLHCFKSTKKPMCIKVNL